MPFSANTTSANMEIINQHQQHHQISNELIHSGSGFCESNETQVTGTLGGSRNLMLGDGYNSKNRGAGNSS